MEQTIGPFDILARGSRRGLEQSSYRGRRSQKRSNEAEPGGENDNHGDHH